MNHTTPRPTWPTDALMIVASIPEEAIYGPSDNPRTGVCRTCGAQVLYADFTMRQAMANPLRHGRPVMFFCTRCAVECDFDAPGVIIDLRPLGPQASPARATA